MIQTDVILGVALLIVCVLTCWSSWSLFWKQPYELNSITYVVVIGFALVGVFISLVPVIAYSYSVVSDGPICVGSVAECELVDNTSREYTKGLYRVLFDRYPTSHLVSWHFKPYLPHGVYYFYDRTIDIIPGDASGSYYVWLHELGHHFYAGLSSEDRIEFGAIYDAAIASNSSDEFVSEYARSNVNENFAESFAALVIGYSGGNNSTREFIRQKMIEKTGCAEECVYSS